MPCCVNLLKSDSMFHTKDRVRCTEDLFEHGTGVKLFTKGKVYEAIVDEGSYLRLVDDEGIPHTVTSGRMGWLRYFNEVKKKVVKSVVEGTKDCI